MYNRPAWTSDPGPFPRLLSISSVRASWRRQAQQWLAARRWPTARWPTARNARRLPAPGACVSTPQYHRHGYTELVISIPRSQTQHYACFFGCGLGPVAACCASFSDNTCLRAAGQGTARHERRMPTSRRRASSLHRRQGTRRRLALHSLDLLQRDGLERHDLGLGQRLVEERSLGQVVVMGAPAVAWSAPRSAALSR